ncbi:MAG: S-adenosylmethionine:tRNA ribosyltransferase-isomerase [Bacteroidales bacterium]|nr:S-adenosylmethionine:tRNA ribosyltransferase-isomerase [Bacteroidales bacterium]
MNITSLSIEDFNYPLPDERIAKYPIAQRDQSKLLSYNNGQISEHRFFEIPELLPENTLLVFNETRVIQARLLFRKETGAQIELFCLEPVEPVNDFQLAMQQQSPVTWKCMVGNAKKWKSGKIAATLHINNKKVQLFAEKKEKLSDAFLVEFSWEPKEVDFLSILETAGLTPLPPYLHRQAETSDKERYQTVFAKLNGSVAAPTAGLHFTDDLLKQIADKGIRSEKLILHVGAGTFKPVSEEKVVDHEMHTEKIRVPIQTLKNLHQADNKIIIPVGTTSMRSLESLFWMALNKLHGKENYTIIEQWAPYQTEIPEGFTTKKALKVLIEALETEQKDTLDGATQMIIVPSYQYRFAQGLITNFHQPKSTLLLLVAAMVGDDWKKAYDFALNNNFRFLSYGDSCLFLPRR